METIETSLGGSAIQIGVIVIHIDANATAIGRESTALAVIATQIAIIATQIGRDRLTTNPNTVRKSHKIAIFRQSRPWSLNPKPSDAAVDEKDTARRTGRGTKILRARTSLCQN